MLFIQESTRSVWRSLAIKRNNQWLVGGLEHVFSMYWEQSSQLIFFRGVETTNQIIIYHHINPHFLTCLTMNQPIISIITMNPSITTTNPWFTIHHHSIETSCSTPLDPSDRSELRISEVGRTTPFVKRWPSPVKHEFRTLTVSWWLNPPVICTATWLWVWGLCVSLESYITRIYMYI